MARKQKKFHFIYKTTNLINNNFYVGMHSTDTLDDGYVGSGKRLWWSIKKYGKENFNFEILEFLPDRKKLKEREKEIINEEFLKDPLCLNIRIGGEGGFMDKNHQFRCSQAAGIRHREKLKTDEEYRKKRTKQISEANKKNHMLGKMKSIQESYSWVGKKHKPETIEKIKNSKKGQGVGEKNSQFGTKWITNGFESKRIKKDDILPEGWRYGQTRT